MPAADRVLDFSHAHVHLSVRDEQLVIQSKDQPAVSVPVTEVAVVLLGSPRLSLTQPVLARLAAVNAGVVVCGENHLPAGMLLPMTANALSAQRLRRQCDLSQPHRKRLWQSVVVAKIRAQAACLDDHGVDGAPVRTLAGRVRSGDPDNLEATAAQRYWPLLFGPDFRRRPDGPDCNRLLNYGYAVLRAAVARAVCGAGLHPSLGIHHHARGNPFCLVDDLMEPYRPLVDHAVRSIVGEWGADATLTPAVKQRLVEAVMARVRHAGEWRASCEWFDRTAQSVLAGRDAAQARVFYPEGLFHAERP